MILFIICCVLCGLIAIAALLGIIACWDDPEAVACVIVLAALVAILPTLGVAFGITANSDDYQEPKYQELVIEHDTLCEAIDNGGLADVGIMSRVVDYNKDVAYNKAKRSNKWVGYFVDKAYERVDVIDYKNS